MRKKTQVLSFLLYISTLLFYISCGLSSNKSNDFDSMNEASGISKQIPLDVQITHPGVEIYNIKIDDNIIHKGVNGISVTFDCNTYGFKSEPLYFYAYVLYENDIDFVTTMDGKKVYGLETSTSIFDAVKYQNGITLYIPYSLFPKQYNGELCIDIVVIDGYDNIITTKRNNRIYYSTL